MKVKCFDDINTGALERKINRFFEENNIILIDVRYSSCYEDRHHTINYSAMIIYREDN